MCSLQVSPGHQKEVQISQRCVTSLDRQDKSYTHDKRRPQWFVYLWGVDKKKVYTKDICCIFWIEKIRDKSHKNLFWKSYRCLKDIFQRYVIHAVHKGGSRHKNWCMARVLSFIIRYFSNYYTLHRSDLAARAAPLDLHFVQHLDG